MTLCLTERYAVHHLADIFEIVEKENGAEALEYIKDHADEIDVIMLDLVNAGYGWLYIDEAA